MNLEVQMEKWIHSQEPKYERILRLSQIITYTLLVSSIAQAQTPPETEIISGPIGSIGYQDPTFWWLGVVIDRPVLGYDYAIGGKTAFSEENHLTIRDLADGSYTFSVWAVDVDGIKDPTPATRNFQIRRDPQPELEFNDRQQLANVLQFNRIVEGSSLDNNDVDWFQFSVPPNIDQLIVTFKRKGGTGVTDLTIYRRQTLDDNLVSTFQVDASKAQFYTTTLGFNGRQSTTDVRHYLKIQPQSVDAEYRPYFLTVSAVTLEKGVAWDSENNDTFTNANAINLAQNPQSNQGQALPSVSTEGLTLVGDRNKEDDPDWFRLHISKRQNLTVHLDRPRTAGKTTIEFYRSPLIMGDEANRQVGQMSVDLVTGQQAELVLPVTPGDYFLALENGSAISGVGAADQPYFITLSTIDLDDRMVTEVEPNNVSPFLNPKFATPLTIGQTLIGNHWNGQTDIDWFQIDLSQEPKYERILQSVTGQANVQRSGHPVELEHQPFLLIDFRSSVTVGSTQIRIYDTAQQLVGQLQVSVADRQSGQVAVPVTNNIYAIQVSPQFQTGTSVYQLTPNIITSLTHSGKTPLALGEQLTVWLQLPEALDPKPRFDLIGNFSPTIFPERLLDLPMVYHPAEASTHTPTLGDPLLETASRRYVGTFTPQPGDDVVSATARVRFQLPTLEGKSPSSTARTVEIDLPVPIQIDTVAPRIDSIQHDGIGVLTAGDRLTVQLMGDFDPSDQIYVEIVDATDIDRVQLRLPISKPLTEDAHQRLETSTGQIGTVSGHQTAILTVLETHRVLDGIVTARIVDQAGNTTIQQHQQHVIILGLAPKIDLIRHNADRPLRLGETLTVMLKPHQAGLPTTVYFQIGDRTHRHPMIEQDGTYQGSYTVTQTDNLSEVQIHVFYTAPRSSLGRGESGAGLNGPQIRISLPERVILDGILPTPVQIRQVADVPGDNGYFLQAEWEESTDPKTVGYHLYLADRPIRSTDLPLLMNLQSTQTQVAIPENGRPYYLAVTAVSQVGNESEISLASLSDPVVAVDNQPPDPVVVVTAADTPNDFGRSVTVSWTFPCQASDFSHYQVYQSTTAPTSQFDPRLSQGQALISSTEEVTSTTSTGKQTSSVKTANKALPVAVRHPYVTEVEVPTSADLTDLYFSVTAVDLAGNESLTVAQSIASPVQSKPDLEIEPTSGLRFATAPIGLIRHPNATFRWTPVVDTNSPEPGPTRLSETYYYQLDGGRLTPVTQTTLTLTGLSVGQHELVLLTEGQQQSVRRQFSVQRSSLTEQEPNDHSVQADILPPGWQISGTLTIEDTDVYRLEVNVRGVVDLYLFASSPFVVGRLSTPALVGTDWSNSSVVQVFRQNPRSSRGQVLTQIAALSSIESGTDFWGRLSFGVEEGVYFLQVKDRGIAPNAPAKYGLACQFSATNNWEVEPNNLAPNMVIPVQPNPTDQTAENYPWGVIFGTRSRGLSLVEEASSSEDDSDLYRIDIPTDATLILNYLGTAEEPATKTGLSDPAEISIQTLGGQDIPTLKNSIGAPGPNLMAVVYQLPAGNYQVQVIPKSVEYQLVATLLKKAEFRIDNGLTVTTADRLTIGDRLTIEVQPLISVGGQKSPFQRATFWIPPVSTGQRMVVGEPYLLPEGLKIDRAEIVVELINQQQHPIRFPLLSPIRIDTVTSPITDVRHDARQTLIVSQQLQVTVVSRFRPELQILSKPATDVSAQPGSILIPGERFIQIPLNSSSEQEGKETPQSSQGQALLDDGLISYRFVLNIEEGDLIAGGTLQATVEKANGAVIAKQAEQLIFIDGIPPSAITPVSVEDLPDDQGGQVKLSWTAPETNSSIKSGRSFDYYEIYRSTSPADFGTLVAEYRPDQHADTFPERGMVEVIVETPEDDVPIYFTVATVDKAGNQTPVTFDAARSINNKPTADLAGLVPLSEIEPNPTPATATLLPVNRLIHGFISSRSSSDQGKNAAIDDIDYYQIQILQTGRLALELVSKTATTKLVLQEKLDPRLDQGGRVVQPDVVAASAGIQLVSMRLNPGQYLIQVRADRQTAYTLSAFVVKEVSMTTLQQKNRGPYLRAGDQIQVQVDTGEAELKVESGIVEAETLSVIVAATSVEQGTAVYAVEELGRLTSSVVRVVVGLVNSQGEKGRLISPTPPPEGLILIDTIPPRIFTSTHSATRADGSFRQPVAGHLLTVTLTGDPSGKAFFTLGSQPSDTVIVEMVEADSAEDSGRYQGQLTMPSTEVWEGQLALTVTLVDPAGNQTTQVVLPAFDQPMIRGVRHDAAKILKLGDTLTVQVESSPETKVILDVVDAESGTVLIENRRFSRPDPDQQRYQFIVQAGDNFVSGSVRARLFYDEGLPIPPIKGPPPSPVTANRPIRVDTVAPPAVESITAMDVPNDSGNVVEVSWSQFELVDLDHYRLYKSLFPISRFGDNIQPSPDLVWEIIPANITLSIGKSLISTPPTEANEEKQDTQPKTMQEDGRRKAEVKLEQNDVDYYIGITAMDLAGNESPMVTSVVQARDDLAPATAIIVSAGDTPNDMGRQVTLEWQAVSQSPDFAAYHVYQSVTPITDVTGLRAVAVLADPYLSGVEVATPTDNRSYFYALTVWDKSGNQSPLGERSVTGAIQSIPNLTDYWRDDTTVRLVSAPIGIIRQTNATFRLMPNIPSVGVGDEIDRLPQIFYRLDQQPYRKAASYQITLHQLTPGTHTFSVKTSGNPPPQLKSVRHHTLVVQPAFSQELEPNDTVNMATALTPYATVQGANRQPTVAGDWDDIDWYRIDLPPGSKDGKGRSQFDLYFYRADGIGRTQLALFAEDLQPLLNIMATAETQQRVHLAAATLEKTLFLRLRAEGENPVAIYQLSVSADEWHPSAISEAVDLADQPASLNMADGTDSLVIFGQSGEGQETDSYQLDLSGTVAVALMGERSAVKTLDLDRNFSPRLKLEIFAVRLPESDGNRQPSVEPYSRLTQVGLLTSADNQQLLTLSKGSYDFVITPTEVMEEANYQILIQPTTFSTLGQTEQEPNNSMALATVVPIFEPLFGSSWHPEKDHDWYRIDVLSTSATGEAGGRGWISLARPIAGGSTRPNIRFFGADAQALSAPDQGQGPPLSVQVYEHSVWIEVTADGDYHLMPFFVTSATHNGTDRILGGDPTYGQRHQTGEASVLDQKALVVEIQLLEEGPELQSTHFKLSSAESATGLWPQLMANQTMTDQGKGRFSGRLPIPPLMNLDQGRVTVTLTTKGYRGTFQLTDPVHIDTWPPSVAWVRHSAVQANGEAKAVGLNQEIEVRLLGEAMAEAKFYIRSGTSPLNLEDAAPRSELLAKGLMRPEQVSADGQPEPPESENQSESGFQTYVGRYTVRAGDTLSNGQVSAELIDLAGNVTIYTAKLPLVIDTTPPAIEKIDYQVGRLDEHASLIEVVETSTLLAADRLTIFLLGELEGQAYCLFGSQKLPLYDDGTHGDLAPNDGTYTTLHLISKADLAEPSAQSGNQVLNGFLIDQAGNINNRFSNRPFTIDVEPPRIESIEHNGKQKSLIRGDRLVVRIKGETGGSASFDIGHSILGLIMVDDGSDQDQKAGDGIYTGVYLVEAALKTEIRQAVITGHLLDEGGNKQLIRSAQRVTIDALPPDPITRVTAMDVPQDQGNLLKVSWSAPTELQSESSDFRRYQIYREAAPIGSTFGLIPVPATLLDPIQTQVRIEVPRNNFDYYIAVTAVDAAGNESGIISPIQQTLTSPASGQGQELSTFGPVQAIDNLAPPAVVGVTAQDRPADNGKVILLQWQPLPTARFNKPQVDQPKQNDFQAYWIYLQAGIPIEHLDANEKPAQTITDPNVYQRQVEVPKNQLNYYLAVTAIDENGNMSVLAEGSTVGPVQALDQIPPEPVKGVRIGDTPSDGGRSVTVEWNPIAVDEISHYLIYLSDRPIQPPVAETLISDRFPEPVKHVLETTELDRGESQSSIAISEEAFSVEEQISVPEDIDLYAAVVVVDAGGNRSALGPDSVAGPVRAVSNVVFPQTETVITSGFDLKSQIVLPAGVVGLGITTLDIIKPDDPLLLAQIEEANFYLGTANIDETYDSDLKPTRRQLQSQIKRLSEPAELTLSYPGGEIPASITPDLRIFRLNPYGKLSLWELVPGKQVVDIENRTVTAKVTNLTVFRVARLQLPANLDQVVVFPNPFIPSQSISGQVTFDKLTENATVSIYTLDGDRVRTQIESTTGRAVWDGRNEGGADVVSGLYVYLIQGDGVEKVGQVMVIR